jgi:hybrid cluster-associated redox disulfide protein
MKKDIVTKGMLIGEIVKKYPKSIKILLDHGLQCVGCHVATWETIEQAASGHGIDPDKLIDDLNKNLAKK